MCVRREKEKTDRKTGERLESFCKQRISSFREENKKTYLPMPSKGTYSPVKVFATLPLCLSKIVSYRSLRVTCYSSSSRLVAHEAFTKHFHLSSRSADMRVVQYTQLDCSCVCLYSIGKAEV